MFYQDDKRSQIRYDLYQTVIVQTRDRYFDPLRYVPEPSHVTVVQNVRSSNGNFDPVRPRIFTIPLGSKYGAQKHLFAIRLDQLVRPYI